MRASWRHLGGVLGRLEAVFEVSWGALEVSVDRLEPSLEVS